MKLSNLKTHIKPVLFFTLFRPPYPEHDSSQILAIKNSCYKQHIDAIRTYYKKSIRTGV